MTCSDEAGVSVLKRSLYHKLCMQQYDNLTQDHIHVVLVDHVSCLGCCSALLTKSTVLYFTDHLRTPDQKGEPAVLAPGFNF